MPSLKTLFYLNCRIVRILKNSYPKFSFEIFADRGTEKALLMNSIYMIIQDNKKHHHIKVSPGDMRAEQFVLIPLLKANVFALPGDMDKYNI